jgi:hypothetical protein
MIKKYKDYNVEKLFETLLLESKIEFSKGFSNILISIKDNRIASELLRLNSQKVDADFVQNFIDVSSEKDSITFTPQRKADEILGQEILKWEATSDAGNRVLTHNKNDSGEYKNRHIFDKLGYTPQGEKSWSPDDGDVGTIKGEVISEKSGKTYCYFISENDPNLICVINKEAIKPLDDSYEKVWKTSRNPFKVGRFARSVLNSAGVKFSDREIEEFTNAYKSGFDIVNDALGKFELVSGDQIAYWYKSDNYESQNSTLGNSCMKEKNNYYFEIYTQNPDVCSLLILYSDNGRIIDGRYKSDTIKGRALIWKLDDEKTFMDRIYYTDDSIIELFKSYAQKNNWFYKTRQNSDTEDCDITDGKTTLYEPVMIVTLDNIEFDMYPYIDTICYFNIDDKKISNNADSIGADKMGRSTGGWLDELDD